jgi:hypothetical protein
VNDGTRLRLTEAERFLTRGAPGAAWPRSVVWLIRLALEHELDCFWTRRNAAVRRSRRMRSKLLALGVVTDRATGHAVAELWSTLSRAAHHHHYELAPTAAELRNWMDDAHALCDLLATHAFVPAHARPTR